MSYFGPGGKPLTCQAVIENTTSDGHRKCVLANGHYLESGPGGSSWHTDCPDAVGKDRPPRDNFEHSHSEHFSCLVWADHAEGAMYADQPARDASDAVEEAINRPSRTLTDLGGYRADLVIGDMTMSVYGPGRFVAWMIKEAASAFEEEAER